MPAKNIEINKVSVCVKPWPDDQILNGWKEQHKAAEKRHVTKSLSTDDSIRTGVIDSWDLAKLAHEFERIGEHKLAAFAREGHIPFSLKEELRITHPTGWATLQAWAAPSEVFGNDVVLTLTGRLGSVTLDQRQMNRLLTFCRLQNQDGQVRASYHVPHEIVEALQGETP